MCSCDRNDVFQASHVMWHSRYHHFSTGAHCCCCRALHTVLVMSGASSTACLQLILPPVITAMSDNDTDVIKLLAACCKLVGAFVSGNSWLPLIIDAVSDPKAGNASKANALVVLSCLVHAAAAAQQAADEQLQRMLIDALAAEDLRGADHVGVQTQLLAVIANLLLWLPVDRVQGASGQQLYLILLQLHGNAAADASSGGSCSAAANVLQLLARQLGLVDAGQIAEQYASQLLPQLTVDAGSWTTGSPHLLAFMSLLRMAGRICLQQLLPDVVQVSTTAGSRRWDEKQSSLWADLSTSKLQLPIFTGYIEIVVQVCACSGLGSMGYIARKSSVDVDRV